MRLVLFEQYRRRTLGSLEEDGRILDLSAAASAWLAFERRDPLWRQEVELRLPADVGRYLAGGTPSRVLVESALDYARHKDDGKGINSEPLFLDRADVRILPPLLSALVISPGAAFRDSPDGDELRPHREFFMRNPFNIQASGAQISIPQELGEEFSVAPRLAVVIGNRLRRANAAEAKQGVFGCCAALEITVRRVETISWAGALFHVQYPHARTHDAALVLGAAVASKDDIGPFAMLSARMTIDGRTVYSGTVPGRWNELCEWIAMLSERVTLQPGTLLVPGGEEETYVQATRSSSLPVEIIQGGSPSAVGITRGTSMTLEIDKVGIVEARVLDNALR